MNIYKICSLSVHFSVAIFPEKFHYNAKNFSICKSKFLFKSHVLGVTVTKSMAMNV